MQGKRLEGKTTVRRLLNHLSDPQNSPDIVVNFKLRQTNRALLAVFIGFAGATQLLVLVR
jgi:hypothetical protein